ncbi:MAG: protein kinase [Gemmatimonadota bacterium]|nr:protein kinase [Gemmatimonadota bacterium]
MPGSSTRTSYPCSPPGTWTASRTTRCRSVEGESLQAALARGPLPIADVIAYLRDVARGLDYAHQRGVVHRDIKPGNVLLAGGIAVITDFGVAKAIVDAGGDRVTATGMVLGTPAYMAPEQGAADRVEGSADLYALGAMAYEMIAGHPPFAGRSAQATLAAHATEAPVPVDRMRPATPLALAALVMQCLEKRPADRPRDAAEVLRALDGIATSGATSAAPRAGWRRALRRRWVAAAALLAVAAVAAVATWRVLANSGADIRTIAVLPFENASGDSGFNYLEDGLGDQVRDALNRIGDLKVKARSSSQRMRRRDAREIGAALGVGAVVQGTVSPVGSRLHVTAELVRTADDDALWSASYDGTLDALARIQDSIVLAVAGRLHLGEKQVASRGTANAAAYDEFLRGQYAGDHIQWPVAIEHFRAAIALDPAFARAYGALAVAYSNLPTLGQAGADSMNVLARAAARRALALDSTVTDAYLAESNAEATEVRVAESLAPLEHVLRFDSTNVALLAAEGIGLAQVGRVDEGVRLLRRAYARDPLSSSVNGVFGYTLYAAGQFDSAVAYLRRGIAVDPTNALLRQAMGFAFAFQGARDSSLAAFREAFRLGSDAFNGRANLVFGNAVAGRMDDARRERALMARDAPGNSPFLRRAVAQLALGEWDAAAVSLDSAVTRREALFSIYSLACDPVLGPLRGNARFRAIVERRGGRVCASTPPWPIATPRARS